MKTKVCAIGCDGADGRGEGPRATQAAYTFVQCPYRDLLYDWKQILDRMKVAKDEMPFFVIMF